MDARYFADMYATDPDPWGFETRWYEQRKYALTLAGLPKPRYRSAFEPGCSFGVLSEMLAPRCDSLICFELVPEVAARARARLESCEHVKVHALAIPEAWPRDTLDLVVLSEVAYYLDELGIDDVAAAISRTLEPGGHVVAVHYRGKTNYPLSGGDAHKALARHLGSFTTTVATWLEPSFQIDVFERCRP
jgi:hypothetical protein